MPLWARMFVVERAVLPPVQWPRMAIWVPLSDWILADSYVAPACSSHWIGKQKAFIGPHLGMASRFHACASQREPV